MPFGRETKDLSYMPRPDRGELVDRNRRKAEQARVEMEFVPEPSIRPSYEDVGHLAKRLSEGKKGIQETKSHFQDLSHSIEQKYRQMERFRGSPSPVLLDSTLQNQMFPPGPGGNRKASTVSSYASSVAPSDSVSQSNFAADAPRRELSQSAVLRPGERPPPELPTQQSANPRVGVCFGVPIRNTPAMGAAGREMPKRKGHLARLPSRSQHTPHAEKFCEEGHTSLPGMGLNARISKSQTAIQEKRAAHQKLLH